MKFHKLSEVFPLIEGEDFDELVEDIKKNGLRQPIVTFEDQILDGRNRFLACEEAGIQPRFTPYVGDNPIAEIIALNVVRRHLTVGQRAIVAARLANLPNGVNVSAKNKGGQICPPSLSIPEAAKRLNVGERSVKSARRLVREDPKAAKEVEKGKLTLNEALSNLLVASESKRIRPFEPKGPPIFTYMKLELALLNTAHSIDSALKENIKLEEHQCNILFKAANQLNESLVNLVQYVRPSKRNLTLVKGK